MKPVEDVLQTFCLLGRSVGSRHRRSPSTQAEKAQVRLRLPPALTHRSTFWTPHVLQAGTWWQVCGLFAGAVLNFCWNLGAI